MVVSFGWDEGTVLDMDLESFFSLHSSVSRCKAQDLLYLGNTVRAAALADKKGYSEYTSALTQAATGEAKSESGKDADSFIKRFGTGI